MNIGEVTFDNKDATVTVRPADNETLDLAELEKVATGAKATANRDGSYTLTVPVPEGEDYRTLAAKALRKLEGK